MRRVVSQTVIAFTFFAFACGGGSNPQGGAGGNSNSGGGGGDGGAVAKGGTVGSGGAVSATGGASQAGGSDKGSGGASPATGGLPGTGGHGQGGAAGSTNGFGGAAGTIGSGGGSASGGAAGAGGVGSGGAGGASTGAGGTASGGSSGTSPAVKSAGCGKQRTLKDGRVTIQSGGASRLYYLSTPATYDNSHPYRLIFAFHWRGGNINAVVTPPDGDHNTDRPFYGLQDLSGDSTIYIAPEALNGGANGWSASDVPFVDDMLTQLEGDLCIDTSRIFTTGFSWGGAMSWKLACVRADKFRAALVYEPGPVSNNDPKECVKPIPWFHSHGINDTTFDYKGTGLSTLKIFTGLDGCTAATPPDPPANGHVCTEYAGCGAATPVRFCSFGSGENNPYRPNLAGHYPTAKDPGQTTSWIPAEAWSFITRF